MCPVPLQLQAEIHRQGARGDPHQRVQSPVPDVRQDLQHPQRPEGAHHQKTQQQGRQASAAKHAVSPPSILTDFNGDYLEIL